MVAVKVWLAGEGRARSATEISGVSGPVSSKLCSGASRLAGWVVDRASIWKKIRKFEAGAALRGAGDDRSVQRLVAPRAELAARWSPSASDRDSSPDRDARSSEASRPPRLPGPRWA